MGIPRVKIAIVGSGPAGLSAAARAAELGIPHLLLEAEAHLSHTIHRYQKGKQVMAEPAQLPLRSTAPFAAGKREAILQAWNDSARKLGIQVRYGAAVSAIRASSDGFALDTTSGETVEAERVVLAIGLQGNLRKLGCEGEDLDLAQYQLDDPEAYRDEAIVVVGAGDAAIENALALAAHNRVSIVNRRDEFDRAKKGNSEAILKAIAEGRIQHLSNATVAWLRQDAPGQGRLCLDTAEGKAEIACNRVIARLGATPPRAFVESCGVNFPSRDANAVPAVSARYESNVPGLYIIGALAGYPLIKQAMNQGYEVVEYIEGRSPEPADALLLAAKFRVMPGYQSVEAGIARIRERIPVLAPLTSLQLREFLLDSEVHQVQPGALIFRHNDYSDSFYSVLDGGVQIQVDEAESGRQIALGSGQFFGEMSLISGRRRSATVHAGPAGAVLIETPRGSMNKLIASVAAVRRVLDETFLLRAIQAKLAPGLDAAALRELVASASLARYAAGELLFREGDPGDCLHLIRKGSVTVARELAGREVVLAYVPAGQYVGEMALLTEQPRAATVKAAVATETIRLEASAFKALLSRHPQLRQRINDTFGQRLVANSAVDSQGGGGVVQFLMNQGLGEATDVLLIDEGLCVRCDHCEKACADTHGGVSRLDRETGPTYEQLHVPTSCRHCEHPHCMKDCPPDAIHRAPGGEVYITDACIGCGNCERNCPYGVIQMGVTSPAQPSLWRWLLLGGKEPGAAPGSADKGAAKKAVKCDMCKDLSGGPACVRACPTGAAVRVSPDQFLQISRGTDE
ncbi:4Fe-4S dicluster domain-containing protein [Stagnimonas aquatica]|uniref:4Fe-4S dicluster domain-containing protein n=1 Tax=Stagnimonas aquatica TaxID=2689987 RepID=A0A3N0V7M8_9GAMM|nr:4Fe-4S dicluster domain-containing protein [Stagnimonas aquatica]